LNPELERTPSLQLRCGLPKRQLDHPSVIRDRVPPLPRTPPAHGCLRLIVICVVVAVITLVVTTSPDPHPHLIGKGRYNCGAILIRTMLNIVISFYALDLNKYFLHSDN